jgi:hypothetical protein
MIECFGSKLWMDAKFYLFEYTNLWWIGKVQCAF